MTANVLNKLKHDYDYDCETGNCLATWVFTAYPAGADLELEEGPIISETQDDRKFKVDFKYSGYNGEQKHYLTNTVFLSVTENDGRYLISDYEVVYQDETTIEPEEQGSLLDDGIVKLVGSVSSYKIHMVLEVRQHHVTGYYYYDSQGSSNRVQLIGDLHADNSLRLNKYNEQGEETGYFDGTFDGKTYSGSNTNYNREDSLPFSVERID